MAYFVSDVVDQLDLAAIYANYGEEERGQPPYHPRMMTKLLVYGYCVGVCLSRKIQRRVREDIGSRVLAAGNEPDLRTISDFRKMHLEALEGLFEQVLRIALEAGAMKVGRVALDGTKVKANVHIVCKLHSHFPVSQLAVSLLRHPPGSEMDFIDGDGATQAVSTCADRHPLAVSPQIGADVPYPGGGLRTNFRGKCVRIGFIYLVVPVLGRDVIFVQSARRHIRLQSRPHASCSARFERI